MSSFNFGKVLPGPVVVLGLLWLFVFRRKGRNHWGHRSVEHAQRAAERAQASAMRSVDRAQATAMRSTQWAGGPAQTGPPPPPAGQASSATQRPQDRVTEPVQPVWTEDDPLGLYVDEPPAPATRVAAAPPVKGYRGVKPAIVLLTGAALAIAWAAGAQTTLMLVIGLATLGLGMLFGGFLGKTLALFPLGLLLALCIAASTIFPEVPRDFADVKYVAPAQSQIDATNTAYRFDAGSVHLDLTKATFAKGAKVLVDGGAGEVVIKLPPNVDVTGNAAADAGQVDALGKTKGGHPAKLTLSDLGADGKAGPQFVVLDLHLKLGSIRVER